MNDFRLFMEAIKPEIEAGCIKGKGGRLICGINEIKYTEQGQKLPEYKMYYVFNRKTKQFFSWGFNPNTR